ncbi:MAG: cysteine desulfurase NifS [Ignavibacteriae bacterium HGW-Ignavibacteriae-3]|nr:MAG: cysteine desulfurase NifS [Ignavibacteriae bacterium HGW-Ignavibacteriae-3]
MKVYLDNAATSAVHPRVFEKMKHFLTEDFGNPSSIHSFGRVVRVALEEARETVAEFINANPSEIYFTSGGTEANNFVLFGIANSEIKESGRNKVISSKIEHHSVLDSFEELSNKGLQIKWLNPDSDSKVNPENVRSALDESTSLVSLMHVNNETGSVNPINEISNLLKSKDILFHTDAVQSFGKFPLDVKELGVNSLTGSAHKINGPKGTGFAYVKSGTPLSPLLFGGSQERNRRGGTENVAGIAGFVEAIRIAKESMNSNFDHARFLKELLSKGISSIDSEGIVLNSADDSSPFILSVTFKSGFYNNDSESMLMYLDINGVAASNGSACSSGTVKASHVILGMGYAPEDAAGTLRFSFGAKNTAAEIEYALEIIKKMTLKFRK